MGQKTVQVQLVLDSKWKFAPNLKEIMFARIGEIWQFLQGLKTCPQGIVIRYCRTRKYCFDVPGCNGVNEGIHIKHDYWNSEAVGVPFHSAGVEVVPLDSHTLLFILREILTAEAKGHRGQEALRRQGQTILIFSRGQTIYMHSIFWFDPYIPVVHCYWCLIINFCTSGVFYLMHTDLGTEITWCTYNHFTYSEDSEFGVEAISPCHTQHVGQV